MYEVIRQHRESLWAIPKGKPRWYDDAAREDKIQGFCNRVYSERTMYLLVGPGHHGNAEHYHSDTLRLSVPAYSSYALVPNQLPKPHMHVVAPQIFFLPTSRACCSPSIPEAHVRTIRPRQLHLREMRFPTLQSNVCRF